MAGRRLDENAPRDVSGWSRLRGACLVAGLLCALGVMSGAAWSTGHLAHHRAPAAAVAPTMSDGHGTNVRGDQHLLATAAPTPTMTPRSTATPAGHKTSRNVIAIDSVRMRGPPAPAV